MASDSSVTITLDLIGQKAAIAGLTQVTDAVKGLAGAVTSSDTAITDSTDAMADDVTTAYEEMGTAAEEAAARVTEANEEIVASTTTMAEETDAATTSVSAGYARMAASASANLAGGKGIVGSASGATKAMGGLTASLAVFAAGTVIYESVKQFSSYTTALTKLSTMAGLTAGQLGQVNKAIMGMPVSLGQSRTALATAFYNPISEGFGVKGSTYVVTDAAKLTDITGAPLGGQDGTSYAVSTMLQTFGMKPTKKNAAAMTALLHAGVGTGDMNLQQLLAANSTGYFNASRAYGISKQSAMSNLDFFSSQGVSPQSAATRMRMTLALMAAPSAQADKYLTTEGLTTSQVGGVQGQLAALGLNTTKMASILRGPNGINNAVAAVLKAQQGLSPETREALDSKLFGGGRSEATFLTLANNPALANKMFRRVGAMDTTKDVDKAYSRWQQTPAGQMAMLKASLSDLAITIGSVVTPILTQFTKALEPAFSYLTKHSKGVADAFKIMFFPLRGAIQLTTWEFQFMGWAIGKLTHPAEAVGGAFVSLWHTLQRVFDWIMNKVDFVGHLFSGDRTPTTYKPTPGVRGSGPETRFGQSGLMLAGGGFMTRGPTAIVGEGRPQFPEFVIPSDPQYRGRALGLLGALAPRLMADGGQIGGNALGMVGSGAGMVGILAQLVGGHPTGSLATTLQSMSGSSAAALPGAGRVVESAIEAAVPGGLFRQLVMGLVATTFNAAIRSSSMPSVPMASYDSGGWLPEGLSIAHNGTGAPEMVGGGPGSMGGDLYVTLEVDGKVLAEQTTKNYRRQLARR